MRQAQVQERQSTSSFLHMLMFSGHSTATPLRSNALALPYGPELKTSDGAIAFFLAHFTHQMDDDSCSLAAVTLALNILRIPKRGLLTRKLTQAEVLEIANSQTWHELLQPESPGPSLTQLGAIINQTLANCKLDHSEVQVRHAEARSEAKKEAWVEALRACQRNPLQELMLINYNQASFVELATPSGHYAVVGAFCEATRLVLVFDVHFSVVGPYWVDVDDLWESMSWHDLSAQKPRGYIVLSAP